MVPQGLTYLSNNYTPGPGAVVLPSSKYDTMDVLRQTGDRINQWAQIYHRDNENKKRIMASLVSQLDVKPTGMYSKDLDDFVKGKKEMEDFVTQSLVQGQDPFNPRFIQSYNQLLKKRDELQAKVVASNNTNKVLQNAYQKYDPKKHDYDQTIKNITTYASAPLEERMKMPDVLLAPEQYNLDSWIDQSVHPTKGALRQDISSEPVTGKEGGVSFFGTKETKGYGPTVGDIPERAIDFSRTSLENNPKVRDEVYKRLNSLKQGIDWKTGEEFPVDPQTGRPSIQLYENLLKEAEALNQKGVSITPEELYLSKQINQKLQRETALYKNLRETDASKRANAAHFKNMVDKSNAEVEVQDMARFLGGDPQFWQDNGDGTYSSTRYNGRRYGGNYIDRSGQTPKQLPNTILDERMIIDEDGTPHILIKTAESQQRVSPQVKNEMDAVNKLLAPLQTKINNKQQLTPGEKATFDSLMAKKNQLSMDPTSGWIEADMKLMLPNIISGNYPQSKYSNILNMAQQVGATKGFKNIYNPQTGEWTPVRYYKAPKETPYQPKDQETLELTMDKNTKEIHRLRERLAKTTDATEQSVIGENIRKLAKQNYQIQNRLNDIRKNSDKKTDKKSQELIQKYLGGGTSYVPDTIEEEETVEEEVAMEGEEPTDEVAMDETTVEE